MLRQLYRCRPVVSPVSRRAVIVLNPASGRGRAGRMRAELERLLAAATARQVGAGGAPVQRGAARRTPPGSERIVSESLRSPVPPGSKPSRFPAQVPSATAGASHRPDTPLEWQIAQTTGPGSATRIAAEAAASGADIVAAAGGDGTLNEVLNGVAGSRSALALLPMGTGNDFARTVGLYGRLPLAVQTLFDGDARPIDAGHVAGRWFLNVAGCGFDAAVAERANRGPRWLSGAPAYIAAVIATIARFRPAGLRLTLDGETRELRAMLCSVANARFYGGGMRIAPDARLDDGLFDVCLLAEAGVLEFLTPFPRVFRGTHTAHPKVAMLRARQVGIESDRPLPLLIDGEVIGTTPAEFSLEPYAVRFLFPPARPSDTRPNRAKSTPAGGRQGG